MRNLLLNLDAEAVRALYLTILIFYVYYLILHFMMGWEVFLTIIGRIQWRGNRGSWNRMGWCWWWRSGGCLCVIIEECSLVRVQPRIGATISYFLLLYKCRFRIFFFTSIKFSFSFLRYLVCSIPIHRECKQQCILCPLSLPEPPSLWSNGFCS